MGYDEFHMESRRGSVSSGSGCSHVRGQHLKSSPFCTPSSSKVSQSIITDHMVSHYKRVYSAKAAIDASVPRSLTHSVKYNDQIRQERLRRGGRPQSALSLSQTDSRASCSSSQSRLSVEYDDSPYHCARSSTVSSPRFTSSFHAKEIVYPSFRVGSQNHSHHIRPASEMTNQSPEAASRGQQAACSLGASADQRHYKTFQDPAQQTYSGDLLQKHSQHFTRDKPFTPKTLKSETSSYLSQYRFYRAPPRRTPAPGSSAARPTPQETHHGRYSPNISLSKSTKTKECPRDVSEPSQGFHTEHAWSEDEFNATYSSASRQQSPTYQSRERDRYDSSSRFSAKGRISPILKNISAEEEELMYLEFISAVTEDILSRAYISDRFLDRLIKRHVDMNRHHLDVGKMRHLLEGLRKDFEEPTNTSRTEPGRKENGRHDSFQMHLGSGGKEVRTEQDRFLFPDASETTHCNTPDYADPLLASPPACSPETTAVSPLNAEEGVAGGREGAAGSPRLGERVPDHAGISGEDPQTQIGTTETSKEVSNENHEYKTKASEEAFHQDGAAVSDEAQTQEVEELGRSLSESLHVSSDEETASRPHSDTVASGSDDEF
ncbi:spermatogenesis-associated protein 7 homolog isoform X2 [Pseudoliparis swirei]|uniref:spermatogenesis-associated protein 7 homolog isoform X2 n=1 Tax=Pseudoliparis swirei TaxID=2059687 RepID=UPI0024BD81DC|nr:spermatogenesis-associated protein 7 homolog isoform X2 [Pseudoliparis swirei]